MIIYFRIPSAPSVNDRRPEHAKAQKPFNGTEDNELVDGERANPRARMRLSRSSGTGSRGRADVREKQREYGAHCTAER
eukprot:13579181-Heterocapsa_arctica.AAC.1